MLRDAIEDSIKDFVGDTLAPIVIRSLADDVYLTVDQYLRDNRGISVP